MPNQPLELKDATFICVRPCFYNDARTRQSGVFPVYHYRLPNGELSLVAEERFEKYLDIYIASLQGRRRPK